MNEWKKTETEINEVLSEEGQDHYISYLPPDIVVMEGFAFNADENQAETALVLGRGLGTTYLILNGDFREEYEQVYPNREACIEVFKRHPDKVSSWSDKLPE